LSQQATIIYQILSEFIYGVHAKILNNPATDEGFPPIMGIPDTKPALKTGGVIPERK
jgi:hypothetical protein